VHHLLQSIVPKDYKAIKRPVLIDSVAVYRFTAEELAPFITPFEVVTGIAA
jgi:hypothetical protein